MTLEETLAKIKDFEDLIDPREIDEILFWVSSHKSDLVERIHEVDYKVSARRLELIEVEKVYQEQKKLEYTIKILGEFKTNLRRRYDLLTNQFS